MTVDAAGGPAVDFALECDDWDFHPYDAERIDVEDIGEPVLADAATEAET